MMKEVILNIQHTPEGTKVSTSNGVEWGFDKTWRDETLIAALIYQTILFNFEDLQGKCDEFRMKLTLDINV